YKCGHLNTPDKASQNLKLFKADLLDYNSLCSAFEGCIGSWYRLSKTLAGSEALVWSMGKEEIGVDVVTLCPALVWGPILQSTTCVMLLKHRFWHMRRPVADGRYICTSHSISSKDLVEKLKSIYPPHSKLSYEVSGSFGMLETTTGKHL
ncbi:hypothetical protein Tsubulata_045731, partial [Turnera subulata]